MRTTAAVAARALHIPAARIRKWAQRGQICRYRDGSLDAECIASRVARDTIERTGRDYSEWHDMRCGVLRSARNRVTVSA